MAMHDSYFSTMLNHVPFELLVKEQALFLCGMMIMISHYSDITVWWQKTEDSVVNSVDR